MIKAILTDVEGTTSSITFVKEQLFPYARDHIGEFVRTHAEEPEVAKALDEVRLVVGEPLELEPLIKQLLQWMDEDKKITPLKSLQGMVWEAG